MDFFINIVLLILNSTSAAWQFHSYLQERRFPYLMVAFFNITGILYLLFFMSKRL